MTSIREAAAQTPSRRERHIDLLRAVAIGAVVTGHWLMIAVEYDGQGELTGFSALGELSWSHPLTWVFQVMPVFFMVGGFANAASLTAHRRRGGSDAGWLLDRSARLVRPTTVLLVVVAALAATARLLGADPEQVGMATWLVSIPLWFLVAYLGMIVLSPVMYSLHQRLGLLVPVLLLLPVLLGDVLRFQLGAEEPGYGNFLFAWLAIHQIGFAWHDGQLPNRRSVSLPLLLGGFTTLLLLTTVGPYPVSMVTVPGELMQNSSPPTLAMVALAATQLGLILLLRNPSERWLQRPRVWTVVVAVNAVILTVFLWHMSAVVFASVGLHALGLLPTPPVDSTAWLWWQLPWLLILALVLAGLVLAFGRVEARAMPSAKAAESGPPRLLPTPVADAVAGTPGRLLVITVVGYAATLGGLLGIAMAELGDYDGFFGLPTGALLGYLAGAGVLRLARGCWQSRLAAASKPSRESQPV
ncbi:acyltransferase [Natronosporangium hydrolyticum]|uniref:Acyltransferase n=1 Tax=Natronosporangium hydrolyticum TaxID=2811111 RepID=A0A895YCA4_9ACTN|nr:acyltransferase [Natronosporangium hydrolyticum]QSB13073.1 acyltransferase [Natronosporangium hydrolyticum]